MTRYGTALQLVQSTDRRSAGPDAADDFFCLRYAVWYPSLDCAFRTRHSTAPGCLRCEQGRFNLKRHAQAIAGTKFSLDQGD